MKHQVNIVGPTLKDCTLKYRRGTNRQQDRRATSLATPLRSPAIFDPFRFNNLKESIIQDSWLSSANLEFERYFRTFIKRSQQLALQLLAVDFRLLDGKWRYLLKPARTGHHCRFKSHTTSRFPNTALYNSLPQVVEGSEPDQIARFPTYQRGSFC